MIAKAKAKKPKCECHNRPFFPGNVCATVNGFDRIITFRPGYVCTLTGGNSHGRHGMEMLWVLRKNNCAVHFILATDWMPDWKPYVKECSPTPRDLGYHSPTAQYEGQGSADDCPWIKGDCYSDGSPSNAQPAFQCLVSKGEEALWEYLAEYWAKLFSEHR